MAAAALGRTEPDRRRGWIGCGLPDFPAASALPMNVMLDAVRPSCKQTLARKLRSPTPQAARSRSNSPASSARTLPPGAAGSLLGCIPSAVASPAWSSSPTVAAAPVSGAPALLLSGTLNVPAFAYAMSCLPLIQSTRATRCELFPRVPLTAAAAGAARLLRHGTSATTLVLIIAALSRIERWPAIDSRLTLASEHLLVTAAPRVTWY